MVTSDERFGSATCLAWPCKSVPACVVRMGEGNHRGDGCISCVSRLGWGTIAGFMLCFLSLESGGRCVCRHYATAVDTIFWYAAGMPSDVESRGFHDCSELGVPPREVARLVDGPSEAPSRMLAACVGFCDLLGSFVTIRD
jgi:hypothetical protein